MEIIERRENPLLDRVELNFMWKHPNEPTPSLSQMVDAAANSEPGAVKELVFVKQVNTRFGMSATTGLALVYGSEESASIEPNYVSERHKSIGEPSKEEVPEITEEPQEGSEEEEGEG